MNNTKDNNDTTASMTELNHNPKEQIVKLGDMQLHYAISEQGVVSWTAIPSSMEGELVKPRQTVAESEDAPCIPWQETPLREPHSPVQVCLAGDTIQDNCAGLTMQYSSSTKALSYHDLLVKEQGEFTDVQLELRTDDGLMVKQCLRHQKGEDALKLWSELHNTSEIAKKVDHISAVSLGGLTPFAEDDASGDLFLHRFQAGWSSEGRHLEQSLESLELERAWVPHGLRLERFGQCGSKPTQRWMPWLGLEQRSKRVIWALHFEAVGSWQAEVLRRDDALSLSFTEGDRLNGHRQIKVLPGQSLVTASAWLTVCKGDVQDACARLTRSHKPSHPSPKEKDLPIIFNEWCTSWGEPSHENMLAIADRLQGTACRYLVMDAGWYRSDNGADWSKSQGDWQPSKTLFPGGLRATCDAIRERGLIPGLWFEFEVAGTEARLYEKSELFLQRDGLPIQDGTRRFLDLRMEENRLYLQERMFDLIAKCNIGYIKIDYNGNTGAELDGPHSPGSNLANHMKQVVGIFIKLRQQFPDLVIENCASGGQRLTPAYGAVSDMHSFSDAHTCVDIPVLAANVLAVIPASQSQIWAVLTKEDSIQRLCYSLAATFLGRMCLSGDIHNLSAEAWAFTQKAMNLYRKVWPIIKDGHSRRYGDYSISMRKLRGWQAVLREGCDGDQLLVVHCFGNAPEQIDIPVGSGLVASDCLGHNKVKFQLDGDVCTLSSLSEWSACVLWLGRKK